jgi:hypothetical protein
MNTKYIIFWNEGRIWYNDYRKTLQGIEFVKVAFKVDTNDLDSKILYVTCGANPEKITIVV